MTSTDAVFGTHNIREGREWHRRLLADAVDQLPEGVRGRVMESAAFLAIKQDDQATALSLGEEGLRIGRRLGSHDLVAQALNIVGLVARQSGDLDQARASASASRSSRRTGNAATSWPRRAATCRSCLLRG